MKEIEGPWLTDGDNLNYAECENMCGWSPNFKTFSLADFEIYFFDGLQVSHVVFT
jgi:hypothetical protein